MLVIYLEGESLGDSLGSFIGSREPFDVWFKERFAACTGVDLNDPPPLEPADLLAAYTAEEVRAWARRGEDVPPGGSLEEVVIGGTGRATQLGAYTYSATECFDAASGAFAGSATLTAANGDAITGTCQGQVSGTDNPNVIAYEEELELTGGTGR